MKLDILAIGVHPDDVELGCSGTLLKHIELGYKVGILDLTKGELGTRGSAEIRLQEVEASTKIMGVHARENMGFEDGFFTDDKTHQIELIKMLRKYQPAIVITNAKHDRHPDHGRSAQLTYNACFLAGLNKIETTLNGEQQKAFRPGALYNYIQAMHIEPDFVVDVSAQFAKKMEAIKAYKSQFHHEAANKSEAQTFISSPQFMEFVTARAMHYGVPLGVQYAEAFTVNRTLGVKNLMDLL
jgi:bacillithiol biosynthesis deacetylase BshB1